MPYTVTVTRVNESLHQDSEETFDADSVTVGADGSVRTQEPGGRGRSFGATTWGSVTIVRVPGR